MPNWDDQRRPGGYRQEDERDRWRRQARERQGSAPERRSFGENERQERGPDRYAGQDRYGGTDWREQDRRDPARGQPRWSDNREAARYDQDRARYGRDEDAGSAGYRRFGAPPVSEKYGVEPYAYGGQEYGLEGHSDFEGGSGGGWGFQRGAEDRRRNFDLDDPGVGQSAAGYGAQGHQPGRAAAGQGAVPAPAHGHPDHDLDPDYLRWREEQLAGHDRDYAEWRRHQHAQYDDQYRQFRAERREHFGRTFHAWRSQRSLAGGIPDTTVAPGVSGYGDKTGIPGGYNTSFGAPRPSGQLDQPTHLSGDPALSQTGGGHATGGQGSSGQGASGSGGAEFGREPPQVQASADGDVRPDTREAAKDDEARPDDKTARH